MFCAVFLLSFTKATIIIVVVVIVATVKGETSITYRVAEKGLLAGDRHAKLCEVI